MDFGDFNVYHIFTMGFAGAEEYQEQCGQTKHRLWKIENLLEYLKKLALIRSCLGLCSVQYRMDTTQ